MFRATALAIAEVPEMNGFHVDGAFVPREAVLMGVGISLRQGGLIAPAILDALDKDLPALMSANRDLVGHARTLQLRSLEMSQATITVTVLGDQGAETVYGVIYPPQVALVGFGTVVKRPWAHDGMLGVRRVVHVTLSADHGGIYGQPIGPQMDVDSIDVLNVLMGVHEETGVDIPERHYPKVQAIDDTVAYIAARVG